MADVTARRASEATQRSDDGVARIAPLPDPRAVRVAVAPATRVGDEPAIVVSPAPPPLDPSGETLAEPRILGGTALVAPAADRIGGNGHAPATHAPATHAPATRPDDEALLVDGESAALALRRLGHDRAVLVEGQGSAGTRVVFASEPMLGPDGLRRRELIVGGWRIEVEIEAERRAVLRERARRGRETSAHGGPTEIKAIIPGRVVAISVVPGEAVTAGQQLLVVEAMKMQNELRAPREGTIERVAVAPGRTIEVGDLLIVIS